jgi:alkylhydroperoxidase/carboxymuconolactone decarboxylase family protein YurZ
MVHTEEGTLLVPRDANAKPGTEESLPKETRAMIDAAVSAAHGDKEKIRAELVAAHTKARANGAATEGRY